MLVYLICALIISLFLLSFVGLFFPFIPSSLFLWGGFFLYFFFVDSSTLGSFFWVTMVVLTGILFVADLFANSYFVKQYGGSKWGEREIGRASCRERVEGGVVVGGLSQE